MDYYSRCKVRTLELTVQSVEGLQLDRKPATAKNNLFVVVRAESINSYTTCMANQGDTNNNLTWNHKLVVDVPLHASSITLDVKSKTLKDVKDIGIARVAVSEFIGGSVPQHCLQFLSYRLRDWEGRRNGVLNFSVRVVMNSPECVAAVGKVVSSCGFQMRGTAMDVTTTSSSSSSGGGVVVGVPIWWNSYGSNSYNV